MAAEDDKIRYSDIVIPDDSITKLISQLEALSKQFETMVTAVRANAKEIVAGMKSISGATKEGRTAIDDAAMAASRLERAQKELKFSLTDVGKEVAWLKQQTRDNNAMTVEQQKAIKMLSTSYDKLKFELKENINLWKAMSEAERQDAAYGGVVLDNIHNLQARVKTLDDELRLHVTRLTEVQKAEQRLNYLRSEEGQRLLALRKQINEVIAASKGEKAVKDELTKANERLNYVMSDYYKEVQLITKAATEQARIQKLKIQLNTSATGSYNQLAAQYELNKIKLNAMSQEERSAVDIGQKLEAETKRIYQQMIFLQEATGNHRLSVGNYAKAWNGLGNAMNQIVREIPAMTMGINMFFLAISNNVPILIDEIQRVQKQNALLRAEGRPTENIIKTIAKSIFGWQTALILLMTAMSMHGKQIIEYIKRLAGIPPKLKTVIELNKQLAKEMANTNDNYGKNIVSLRKLQTQWNELTSDKEKEKFVKNNKTEWSNLGIAVNSVNEAENVLIHNTEALINAIRHRAKAAAAEKLAAEQYEEALKKRNEAEIEAQERDKAVNLAAQNKSPLTGAQFATPGAQAAARVDNNNAELIEKAFNKRITLLEKEADVAEKTAESYFELADAEQKAALASLRNGGIKPSYLGDGKEPRGRQPRDLTDTINRNDINIEKKYEESITKLQNDEYVKRRKALLDSAKTQARELRDLYEKNKKYEANPDNKYKPLTEEQKQQIAQQQKWIRDTLVNSQKKLDYDLMQLEKERQISVLQTMRETIDWRLQDIENSINEERKIKLQQLEQEEKLIKEQNALSENGNRTETEITAEYAKKRLKIISDYDNQILNLRKADIAAQLEVVEKGSEEELALLLKQNEIARQLALSENRAKPAAQQQSENQINQSFDKKATTIKADFQMTDFDQLQAVEAAKFNLVKHTENQITTFTLQQERDRLQKQIELAEAGSLEWSKKQIEAAKLTVQGIDREISEINNVFKQIGENGLGYTLLEKLGFNDDSIDALTEATNIVIEQFQAILDAEVELAERAVELAKERVDAAKSAYNAEVEARNNGYAHNVATAKKELEQEKKNQLQKQKMLEAAQRRQEALASVQQAVNLVSASALIWSQLGFPLAIPAIAAMWTSFAVAKIKARQVTASSSEEYGEGGLEFLEGGSHASGDDIDLHTKNKRNKNMRAEGGEALAIINKRQTKRYKKVLPDIVSSLNKGTFEDKYLGAFDKVSSLDLMMPSKMVNIDLSKLEKEVSDIRKQNETKHFVLPNGDIVIISGNVKRIIKH